MTIEKEVCIGLAYCHAFEQLDLGPTRSYRWAKRHWMEFLTDTDTDTGGMLQRAAERKRRGRRETR